MDVPGGHRLGVGQGFRKHHRDPDLVRVDVGVGGDDGAGGVVDTLAHHVLPEQSLLLLQQLRMKNQCASMIYGFASFTTAFKIASKQPE